MSGQKSTFTTRPHRRQFIIGPEAIRIYGDWCCHQLDMTTWVSYCPELRADWVTDSDNSSWGLLGLVVETLEDRADPLWELARHPSTAIPDLYASWAGRWVLVGRGQVHMDASGQLSCFYGTAPDNRTWVSSSPALLVDVLSPDALLAVDSRVLRHATGLSWFTPPRSRFEGVRRLLPSQVIELDTGKIRPRPLLPSIDPSLGYDQTLELLKQSLITALRRLPIGANRLWLGLSAGADSRLVFAMAHYAGVDVIPFTRIAARMSVADRVLPPKLAQELGYEHIFTRGRKRNPYRQHLVNEHSAGHVSEGDAEPFVKGERDSLKGISIGGQGFGVGKVLWRKRLPDIINDPIVGAQQIAQAFGEPLTSSATAGIYEWLEWVLQTPQERLDWRDRFYIEQRMAGWQSSKEQVYDLDSGERFFIINSARNYALLLGLEEGCRVDANHQIDLIRRVVPELLHYPCNPPDKYFGVLRASMIKSSYDPLYGYRQVVGKLQRMWRSLDIMSGH